MNNTEHRWNVEPLTHDQLRERVAEPYRPLFEPVRVGPKTAPNRFFVVPYSSGWGMHHTRIEAAHRAQRAEGGWGVVTTGECSISREATTSMLEGLELFDDEDARTIATIADAIHDHGSLAGLELAHSGGMAMPSWWKVSPVAPSQAQSEALLVAGRVAHGMTVEEIRRVQSDWVAAARRGRSAGFDIVYVHCAHSFLPMQFLTPRYNKRTDQYGGSLENRARFLLETLEQVREAVGDDTAISCRFALEAHGPFGIGMDEALEVMRMGDHLVDLWDIAQGGLLNAERDLTPSVLYPEGVSQECTSRAKEVTAKPVVGSSRFTDVDLMLRLVKTGELDFIGAARPSIAEPFMPHKIATGEFRRLRECVGSNRCAFSSFGGMMACSQNATVGEEYRHGWNPERFSRADNADKPVLIVGAGPAGIECGTVLARRGFENVHIIDAAERPGGHLRWFTRLPGFAAWGHVIEHRMTMIEDLQQIQFVGSRRMSAEDVLDYGGAIVIIATGAPWATVAHDVLADQDVPGADASLPNVLTPEQLLSEGKQPPGPRVLVYDGEADLTGLGVAQTLQASGREVTLASPFPDIGFRAHQDNVSFALRGQFTEAGGVLLPNLTLAGVDEAGADFRDGEMAESRIDCDAVALLSARISDDSLYTALAGDPDRLRAAGVEALYRVGDCVGPQNLSEALFSGHRLAREIDAENPAVPLPVPRS